MIVVDCNVLAYLVLPGQRTEIAKKAFALDSFWTAPALWRSEFLSVLATYVNMGAFDTYAAEQFMRMAESIVRVLPTTGTAEVLRLSRESRCSSYDCEYVAAAMVHVVLLVTEDKKILKAFPSVARSLTDFTNAHPATDAP